MGEWHHYYGYWCHNGCLRPDMLSIMIALDRSDRNNGCLQIIRGSHRFERIDHVAISDKQNAVDPERMKYILKKNKTVFCELDPGDAVIFHANAIHRSDQNRSLHRRWTFLICYNAVSNDTFTHDDDRYYVPQNKDNHTILKSGLMFGSNDQEHFCITCLCTRCQKD